MATAVKARNLRPGRYSAVRPGGLAAAPFLLPGLLLFALFVLWPVIQGLRISFYHWNILPGAEQQFVGLANFRRAFTDPVVRVALPNTLLYVAVTVPGQMAVGLALAMALNAQIRLKTLWRVLYYIPVVTSWVVVSFLFRYLFFGGPAPVNWVFHHVLHLLPRDISWLQNAATAQVPITALGIWKGMGWNMVMFLAALQSIPRELYEAAAVDGAGRWHTFRRITLPLLRPIILYLTVMLTIGAFGVMVSVQLLTNGGPLNRTQTMLLYMYQKGFRDFDFGYGFALAALMALLMFIISLVQFRLLRARTEW